MNYFIDMETQAKTIYARMFFRKRFWYTSPSQLKAYSESDKQLATSLTLLYQKKFLRSDEDAVYESDFERVHELFECMQMHQVKTVEMELARLCKGSFGQGFSNKYDCISNNPFWHLKQTEVISEPSTEISKLISLWVREASEHSLNLGKKLNPILNFQVNDKVKLINKLMHRIMSALGAPSGDS